MRWAAVLVGSSRRSRECTRRYGLKMGDLRVYARPGVPFIDALADLRTVRQGGALRTPHGPAASLTSAGFFDVAIHASADWRPRWSSSPVGNETPPPRPDTGSFAVSRVLFGQRYADDLVMDVTLRRATPSDADAVADLYLRARNAAADIPALIHSDGEIRGWIAERVIPRAEVWIAENEAVAPVGLAVLAGDWLDHLYVEPTLTGRGVGAKLLRVAKRERPSGLRLWTFASNIRAQRFYERHGFVEIDRTDGDNEERAPDILYVWRAAEQRA